jgi:hypothetical protein
MDGRVRVADDGILRRGVALNWEDFRVELRARLLEISRDLIVVSALFFSIWILSRIEHWLYPSGLRFFEDTFFEVRADVILDAAHAGIIGLFSLRTIYFLARGMFAQ